MHVVFIPLPFVPAAISPFIYAEPCYFIFKPGSFVNALINPLINSITAFNARPVFARVLVTVDPNLDPSTMLLVLTPLAIVVRPILVPENTAA
jgi:hypothetical protein